MSCIAIGIDCFAGGASGPPVTPLSIFGASLVGATQWVDMDLGEFIKINRAATAPEITALRAYFTSFWGFAA